MVDTNILLDVAAADPDWSVWSQSRLRDCALRGALLINDVVYAELSAGFVRIEEVDALVATLGLRRERSPTPALFLAAKAHLEYRRRGGARTGVLADFFIGADAATRSVPLLTRDPRRYRAYFPSIRLICP